ncbi:MAG: hypothetical protein ACYSR5_10315 [Planctomycetota bacterium]
MAKTRPRRTKGKKATSRRAVVYVITSSGLRPRSSHDVERSATASEIFKTLGIKKKKVSSAASIVDDLKEKGRIKKY